MTKNNSKKELLRELYAVIESQVAELPLATKPTDIIPGEGDPDSGIILIGEAPGFHEHQARRPFVGKSGQFLRKILTATGTPDSSVYITKIHCLQRSRPSGRTSIVRSRLFSRS
jgi:uracil-DNA glycosylase